MAMAVNGLVREPKWNFVAGVLDSFASVFARPYARLNNTCPSFAMRTEPLKLPCSARPERAASIWSTDCGLAVRVEVGLGDGISVAVGDGATVAGEEHPANNMLIDKRLGKRESLCIFILLEGSIGEPK